MDLVVYLLLFACAAFLLTVCGTAVQRWICARKAGEEPLVKLGRATWTHLHMLVDMLPDRETYTAYGTVANYIETLAQIYPCGTCRRHFQQYIAENPLPRFSKNELRLWLSRFHNAVNRRLGKAEFRMGPPLTEGVSDVMRCASCDDPPGYDEIV